jgi:hypothetical protein
MRSIQYLSFALLAVGTLAGGPALANVCQTDRLMCATTMPLGGFCECTAHGQTEGGKVFSKAPPGRKINATAGGCGAHPNNPGCR